MMAMGCAMNLETQIKKAGQTDHNNIYATAARVRNPLGQEAIAIEIHAEARQPELAYRRTTVTTPVAAPQAAPEFKPPTKSPRGKKANIVVCTPPPKPQPAPPQVVVDEEGYYPSTTPLASAGGTGPGFLQTWGNAVLGNAPMALGVWGAAKVLKPAQTDVNQSGGGAYQQQRQATNNKLLGINSTKVDNPIKINNSATGTGVGVATSN